MGDDIGEAGWDQAVEGPRKSEWVSPSAHDGDAWTLLGQEAVFIAVEGVWDLISEVASGWHQTSSQKENEALLESWEVLCAGVVRKLQDCV